VRTRIGIALSKLRVPANVWTVFILIPAFASLGFLMQNQFLPAAVMFAVAMLIDSIDGAIARVSRKVSHEGVFIDGVVATYVEAFALFGLMAAGLPSLIIPAWSWAAILLFASISMEYFSSLAKLNNLLKEDWAHFYTKPARMGILLIAILAANWLPAFATSLIAAGALLSVVAMFNRQAKALFSNA
jgi:phosphatidylglycerophosphate synthase